MAGFEVHFVQANTELWKGNDAKEVIEDSAEPKVK